MQLTYHPGRIVLVLFGFMVTAIGLGFRARIWMSFWQADMLARPSLHPKFWDRPRLTRPLALMTLGGPLTGQIGHVRLAVSVARRGEPEEPCSSQFRARRRSVAAT
jgi:hypothetical protein